jgi:hypothetical protein
MVIYQMTCDNYLIFPVEFLFLSLSRQTSLPDHIVINHVLFLYKHLFTDSIIFYMFHTLVQVHQCYRRLSSKNNVTKGLGKKV